MKKNLSDFPHPTANCYQVANWLFDLRPDDRQYNSVYFAALAARKMKAAGWEFQDYDFKTGKEIWGAPAVTVPK